MRLATDTLELYCSHLDPWLQMKREDRRDTLNRPAGKLLQTPTAATFEAEALSKAVPPERTSL